MMSDFAIHNMLMGMETEKIRSKLQDIGNMNIRGDPTYFCNSISYLMFKLPGK